MRYEMIEAASRKKKDERVSKIHRNPKKIEGRETAK